MPLLFDLCGLIKYREVAVVVVAIWDPLGNNEIFRRAVNDSTPKSNVCIGVCVCALVIYVPRFWPIFVFSSALRCG